MFKVSKQTVSPNGEPISFTMKVLMAAGAGAAGGLVGTPADMVNVRMQNDIKLPPEKRRKYVSMNLFEIFLFNFIYVCV